MSQSVCIFAYRSLVTFSIGGNDEGNKLYSYYACDVILPTCTELDA